MLVFPSQYSSQGFYKSYTWSENRENNKKHSQATLYDFQNLKTKMDKHYSKYSDKDSTQDSNGPKISYTVNNSNCGCFSILKSKILNPSKPNLFRRILKPFKVKFSKSSVLTDMLSSNGNKSPLSFNGTQYYSCVEEQNYQSLVDAVVCPSCNYECHQVFDKNIPIVPLENVVPDSFEERVIISKSLCGSWITLLDRSDSLNDQYLAIGLGSIKRAVMNRLAIKITSFLECSDTILHFHIHTPLGVRSMRSNLTGEEIVDDDPDAGRWTGTSRTVDYLVPWFCSKKPVKALEQTRYNPKVGKVVETRCILPDPEHKYIMLFNISMYVNTNPEQCLNANRILRPL